MHQQSEFANALKQSPLSGPKLAKALKIPVRTLYAWRNGTNTPNTIVQAEMLKRLRKLKAPQS